MDITSIIPFLITSAIAMIAYKMYYNSKHYKIQNNKMEMIKCIKSYDNPSTSDEIIKKIMNSKNEIIDEILSEDDDFHHIRPKNVK